MCNNAPVTDVQGNPVRVQQLQNMITELATKNNKSYDEMRELLGANTNEQHFVNHFATFLNTPCEAWRAQEEEVTFALEEIDELAEL